MGEQKSPWSNPFQTVFRASLLLLGTVIALNLAVAYLCPLLPWLIGTAAVVVVTWIAVAVVRWKRSQW